MELLDTGAGGPVGRHAPRRRRGRAVRGGEDRGRGAGRAGGALSAGGASWGGGYVTDLPYLPGYYRHQSPLHLNLACLLGGVAGLRLGPGAPLSYLELGCGQGFGALALAVCNPAWRVTGIDFNPAHIAAARELAAEAGIGNAQFIEADLATLTDFGE